MIIFFNTHSQSLKKNLVRFSSSFILIVLISCSFSNSKNEFEKLPNSIKVIDTVGTYFIKVKGNKLEFSSKHPKITNPLLYNDNLRDFNFNGLYRISDKEGNTGFFRFGWINYAENKNIISNLNWFYNDFKLDQEFKEYIIESIKIDKEQQGKLRICTIGDSQTWWSEASILRKQLHILNPDFFFVGSNTDIFSYPHEAEGGDSTGELLARINKVPEADYYTLLIGTNDWQEDISESFNNIKRIIAHLLQKSPNAKIFYLTPLPTANRERDKFNKKLKENVLTFIENNNHISVVNIGEKMRDEKNWKSKYLTADGLHPNKEGVYLMAKQITSAINYQKD
ncbi:SGNH/GDSL hydrolase family protein [Mesonia aestuariivivens]|uniref:SGNH/GDSL hydrolase family protein n=1 Tax=Mesonia aestuariivivens TaxID=2796128 RepID=A0ABS6W117_9FLAO|nr:SGNH/GDSL hydrolase family protein [Mesonia aestuariivivens]MBW2961522.1 SGNH/GDSL hydrolase family protein [Mesonia aestuariivivens]